MKKNVKASEIAKIVGKNLQTARKEKGYTQADFAKLLGKYQSDYSDYETGKVQLDYDKIVLICQKLEITPDELFDGTF